MSSKHLLQKRQRTAVNEYLKQKICEYSQNNPNQRQIDIATHFNSQDPNLKLDRIWVKQVTNSEIFLTELMIKEQVADFAKALNLGEDALKFSNG
ncbi:32611_t:CDS:2 [Racocetra persica]|uniref:32611_t:CDS:1 n=1 Tax=Racocetra persica TaxID=160502 RepID=A0ACA9KL85_9GLOM|nr:32611_t:CDS:2 [Racocetra persica]